MLIAFEGPIAAGKTSLAKRYTAHSGGTPILEDFERNEFLADFYTDKPRWALATQLSFALDRNAQWERFRNNESGLLIADYSPLKDSIFARTLLRGRELKLFERTLTAIRYGTPPVDLIVLLDASNPILLDRIASRKRPYERRIDSSYQDQLRAAYAQELRRDNAPNTLWLDTTELDLDSGADLSSVFLAIDAARLKIEEQRLSSFQRP